MHIALITCTDLPRGAPDDLHLHNFLCKQGHVVEFCVWNDKKIDWTLYDRALVRSTWDYYKKTKHFLKLLKYVDTKTKLINPYQVIRWNLSKKYLLEMSEKGLPIVPTFFTSNFFDAQKAIGKCFKKYSRLIIKPAISAAARNTFILKNSANNKNKIKKALKSGGVLIQPFMERVTADGEISLIYFRINNKWRYSHAVVKRALRGDFRVQSDFGGSVKKITPSARVLKLGKKIVNQLPAQASYARVDLLNWKTSPLIGEVELIEPELFFRFAKGSTEKLLKSII